MADYALLGRPVHGVITARLVVRDGVIVDHLDVFSWDRWARQALPPGRLSTLRPVAHVLQAGIRAALARGCG